MDRLEEIVEQMESGKMMLEELIVRYEEGMKLVKVCQERLTQCGTKNRDHHPQQCRQTGGERVRTGRRKRSACKIGRKRSNQK